MTAQWWRNPNNPATTFVQPFSGATIEAAQMMKRTPFLPAGVLCFVRNAGEAGYSASWNLLAKTIISY
jgi:hypothetical protein